MNLGSHLIERFLHLDPPLTRDLAVRHDLRVPMPDGAVLLADLWAPRVSRRRCRWRCSAARTAGGA